MLRSGSPQKCYGVGPLARQSADQRQHHSDTNRRGREVVYSQAVMLEK